MKFYLASKSTVKSCSSYLLFYRDNKAMQCDSGDCGDGGFRTVVGGDAHSLLTLALFSHSHTFTY